MDETREAARRARRALERTAIAAVFIIPLLMNPSVPDQSGPVKEACMWAAAAVAAWFLGCLWALKPQTMAIPVRLARPAAIWIIVSAASVITAYSRALSAWAALSLLPPIVLALTFGVVARRPGARRRLLYAWVASAAICSLYAVVQHYGLDFLHWPTDPRDRAVGSVGGPLFLGAFLAMSLPPAAALLTVKRTPGWLPGATVLIVGALATSYFIAGWAAAGAGVLLVFYAANRRPKERKTSWATFAAVQGVVLLPLVYWRAPGYALPVGALAVIGLCVWARTVPGLGTARRALAAGAALAALLLFVDSRRPADEGPAPSLYARSAGTDAARQFRWNVATGLIAKRPVIGWGLDGFRAGSPTSPLSGDGLILPGLSGFPHLSACSEWYTAAVDSGVIGLFAWIAVVLSIASVTVDRARAEKAKHAASSTRSRGTRSVLAAAAFGGVVAFAIQGSLAPRGPVTTLGFALMWGLAASLEPSRPRLSRAPARAPRVCAAAFTAIAFLCAAGLLSADVFSRVGDATRNAGRLHQALAWYRAAAAACPMEPAYRASAGACALQIADAGNDINAAQAAVDAGDAFAGNIVAEPGNGIWYAEHALALRHSNATQAIEEAKRATRLAPRSSSCWWALACAQRAANHPLDEMAALRAAIECGSMDPAPYYRLAAIFRERHLPELSGDLLARAAQRFPNATPPPP